MSRLVLVLRHPCLKDLYQFWLRLCDDETLPMADNLDPSAMRPWLDDLAVVDVARNEDGQLSYSYCGRGLLSVFGSDPTGRPVDDEATCEEPAQTLCDDYDQVVHEHIPLARVCGGVSEDSDHTWERLVLPLFSAEGQVEKLLLSVYRLSPPAGAVVS